MSNSDHHLTRCTLCGVARPLTEPAFSEHQRSAVHQAVLEQPIQTDTRSLNHHEGHLALRIACRCAEAGGRAV